MLYQFREYAQKINANQSKDIAETGFETGGASRTVSINFGENFDAAAPYTVVCSGARRGGTSTLPYILSNLGLPMGSFQADTYEDIEILKSRQNAERLSEVIAARNAESDQWGFKVPAIRRGQFGFFDQELRNPVFIYIFRNPLLAAQSYVSQAGSEAFPENRKGFSAAMMDGLQSYMEFTTFMAQTKSPCLLVPMEQLQRAPGQCIEDIAAKLNLDASAEKIAELTESVKVPGFKPRVQK